MNDTLTIREGRHVLRLHRRFAHSPETVWRAVIEPQQLSQWYPGKVTALEPRVGGTLALDYGDGWVTTAVVTACEPPRLFAFTERALAEMPREGDNDIRIELRPDGDGCLMIFSQTFDDRPNAAGYAAGWQGCFDALETLLGGSPAADGDVSIARHERYVKLFGLDQAEVEHHASGWTVRYIRHVARRPVEVVWRELAGSTQIVPWQTPPPAFVAAGVPAGPVTTVEPNARLAFESAGCAVNWVFLGDPGGARIELTQTGHNRAAPDPDAWRVHVEALVARLTDSPG